MNVLIYMWYCCRCGARMQHSQDYEQVSRDQREHLKRCKHQGSRAPWELNITNSGTYRPMYVH